MLKKTAVIGILVVLACTVCLDSVYAARQSGVLTGVTTGKRRIINSNIQQAKRNAVDDALDMALQNAFAGLVSRQVFAANLDFFYNRILSRASDFIIAYRVLGGIESNGYYLVGVETRVDQARLEKKLTDARIINPNKDKPTILFFIAEKTPDDLLPKYWWGNNPLPYSSVAEEIIINRMKSDRFMITGEGPERPDPAFYNVTFGSIYDINAAKDLGIEMKADMVVFGRSTSTEAINRMGEEKTFNAVITLEAYHLDTGEKVVETRVEEAAKSDMSTQGYLSSIRKAAETAARDLAEKIDTYWAGQLRKEHAFDVRIEGMKFLPRFIALKKQLRQMNQIENMQPKEMGSNFALLEVFYKGKPEQFADTVMLKTFDDFGLEILDVSENLVTIRFIEKGLPVPEDEPVEPAEPDKPSDSDDTAVPAQTGETTQ